jgi:hypothetical protein
MQLMNKTLLSKVLRTPSLLDTALGTDIRISTRSSLLASSLLIFGERDPLFERQP